MPGDLSLGHPPSTLMAAHLHGIVSPNPIPSCVVSFLLESFGGISFERNAGRLDKECR